MAALHTDTQSFSSQSISLSDLNSSPASGSLGAPTLQTLGKRLQSTYHVADDERLPVRITELVERLARREPAEK